MKTIELNFCLGFLCGQCSENEGVDLTLRGCKKCSVGDAIIVALIGKYINTKKVFVIILYRYSYTCSL